MSSPNQDRAHLLQTASPLVGFGKNDLFFLAVWVSSGEKFHFVIPCGLEGYPGAILTEKVLFKTELLWGFVN